MIKKFIIVCIKLLYFIIVLLNVNDKFEKLSFFSSKFIKGMMILLIRDVMIFLNVLFIIILIVRLMMFLCMVKVLNLFYI